MPNPNPVTKFKQIYDEPMADRIVGTRLPVKLDAFVRSLPNQAEWIRAAIAEKYEREQQKS